MSAAPVPMFDPQGNVRGIPVDQVDAAIQAGGKKAVAMFDPQGTQRYVPEDQVQNAIGAGGKYVNPPQSQPPKQSLLQRMGLVPGSDAAPQLAPGQQAGPTYGSGYDIAADSAKGLGKIYLEEGPQKAYQGAKDIGSGQYARGAHEVITGALNTAGPLAPEAIAAKPLMALRALGGGLIGSNLAGAAAKGLGATPDQENLAGDVGGLAGGFTAVSGLTRALFETPLKELAAKSGAADTIIDLLEKGPRKVLADALKTKLQSSLQTTGTKPATLNTATNAATGALDKPLMPSQETPASPAPESAPVQSPLPEGAYGKTAGRSNLKANQRQLASPTAAASPNPSTAPVAAPEPAAPGMSQFYGKSAGKSNLSKNQRQLANPSGAASPNPSAPPAEGPHPPEIMRILNKAGAPSNSEMNTLQNYFAKQKLANMLSGSPAPAPAFSLDNMLKYAVGK